MKKVSKDTKYLYRLCLWLSTFFVHLTKCLKDKLLKQPILWSWVQIHWCCFLVYLWLCFKFYFRNWQSTQQQISEILSNLSLWHVLIFFKENQNKNLNEYKVFCNQRGVKKYHLSVTNLGFLVFICEQKLLENLHKNLWTIIVLILKQNWKY